VGVERLFAWMSRYRRLNIVYDTCAGALCSPHLDRHDLHHLKAARRQNPDAVRD
jgi:hypothetical protein